MPAIPTIGLGLTAALLVCAVGCAGTAFADVTNSSLAVETTVATFSETTTVNAQLAAARPDLSLSPVGLAFGSNSSSSIPLAVRAQNFMRPPQQLPYYSAAILNYFLTPPADTRAYDNQMLITYPGYAVSTWTDRVSGAPSLGVGSPTDLWTASVYFMAKAHPSSAPMDHPILDVMPEFHAHPELDNHHSFRP